MYRGVFIKLLPGSAFTCHNINKAWFQQDGMTASTVLDTLKEISGNRVLSHGFLHAHGEGFPQVDNSVTWFKHI
jgi:hypothetical protein